MADEEIEKVYAMNVTLESQVHKEKSKRYRVWRLYELEWGAKDIHAGEVIFETKEEYSG